jgi:hypothetical protein
LGFTPGNRSALARYWEGARIGTTPNQHELVGHLLGIHVRVRLLFPHNRDVEFSWMKLRNRAFDGMTPVEGAGSTGSPGC